MDLQAVLKKTKQRADRVTVDRAPPSIATKDRPYDTPSPTPLLSDTPIVQDQSTTIAKSGPNQVQIGSESGSNQVQKPVQIGFKSGSSENHKIQPSLKSGSESGSTLVQIGSESGSNQVQINQSDTLATDVLMVRGDQRRVLDYLFDFSLNSGDRSTPSFSSSELGKTLQMPQESIRTALKRLLQRGVLLRRGFQRGRTGWSSFELNPRAYRELLDHRKSGSNWVQNGFKSGSESGSKSGSTVSSSSSSLYLEELKTTTTGESESLKGEGSSMSPEWQGVDGSPLAAIGFTQTHLMQIVRQAKLKPDEVQDSIEFFAFDLKRNGLKPNGPPLNFFMGILRKGIPYAPPDNYESPSDEARRKTMEFKARKEQERETQIKQLIEFEFSEWRRGVSSEQLATLLPEYAKRPGPIQDSALRAHFEKNVWPEKMAETQQQIGMLSVGEGQE